VRLNSIRQCPNSELNVALTLSSRLLLLLLLHLEAETQPQLTPVIVGGRFRRWSNVGSNAGQR